MWQENIQLCAKHRAEDLPIRSERRVDVPVAAQIAADVRTKRGISIAMASSFSFSLACSASRCFISPKPPAARRKDSQAKLHESADPAPRRLKKG
jgi:hypothetical protein